MREEPDIQAYYKQFEEQYEKLNYNKNLSSKVLSYSHRLIEKKFNAQDHFSKILEVGAGSGQHMGYVQHSFDLYVLSDANSEMLKQAKHKIDPERAPSYDFRVAKAHKLPFDDHSFDRVIATHVLEHVPEPHKILREWARVVKKGGLLSIVLPCDPGLAWRFGRMLGVRKRAEQAGLDYDYWMAREHINPIFNLTTFIDYYFENIEAQWWPMRLPFADINLIYAVHIHL